jgi:hypothetical protein
MTWIGRWLKRRNEIAHGADADLLAGNARGFSLSAILFIVAGLLFWIGTKVPLAHAVRVVLNIIGFVLFVASLVLACWAQAMDRFLKSPDREDPPSILKQ